MKILLVLFFNLLSFIGLSTVITSLGGNWNSPATWNLGRIPICGDTIIIPSGVTVHIPANVNLNSAGCDPVTILVDGLLTFANGKKIRLSSGGCIQISLTGSIQPSGVGGGSSELIEIGGVDWWKASDGTLLGSSQPGGVDLGCSVLLPVILTDYSIEYGNTYINLNWITTTEINCDYYIIESSKDGMFWQESGLVKSIGNTNDKINHTFIDRNPFSGLSYYRVSNVDFNGEFSILFTISSEFKNSNFSIYPIPVNKTLFIDGYISDFKIVNLLGSDVIFNSTVVDDKILIDFSGFNNGVYYLKTQQRTEKILVRHQ